MMKSAKEDPKSFFKVSRTVKNNSMKLIISMIDSLFDIDYFSPSKLEPI